VQNQRLEIFFKKVDEGEEEETHVIKE